LRHLLFSNTQYGERQRIARGKGKSYQKVKKEPGVGQSPTNSKSLGAGYADVQTNAMLASR